MNEKFVVSVIYIQPAYEELERRFPAYVDTDLRGDLFDSNERCKGVSKKNREVAFEYVHLDCNVSTDKVLAEMGCKGLRPALYEELLSFAESYPDEQQKYPIVAFGSEIFVGDHCYIPYLGCSGDNRYLSLYRLASTWFGHCRFLAVRE